MKDPLTHERKETWLKLVIKQFHEKYEKALNCGALSEEDLSKDDHTLARCVLIITARQFEPLSGKGKQMLENLEKFV